MAEPIDSRVRELAFDLNLKSRNKRPSKIDWLDAYRIMVANDGKSRAELIKLIKKSLKVSRSHAVRILCKAEFAESERQRIRLQELD